MIDAEGYMDISFNFRFGTILRSSLGLFKNPNQNTLYLTFL